MSFFFLKGSPENGLTSSFEKGKIELKRKEAEKWEITQRKRQ